LDGATPTSASRRPFSLPLGWRIILLVALHEEGFLPRRAHERTFLPEGDQEAVDRHLDFGAGQEVVGLEGGPLERFVRSPLRSS
jgi:hypothetical protein